ncbi:MAG: sigma-70 family RNA polymerase sigma factor [Actinomycetota bacterium]|nr:sigma-70 family RNA polymerase sigma factor [Actinomycetota bacterium]
MRSTDPLRDLFDAAREGDDRAVRELVTRTQPVVWRVCSVLGSVGEEEDLVQETYLRALRSAAGYRGEAPVQAWLLAIARNVCADHVRRRARQRRLVDRLARTNPTDAAPPAESVHQLLLHLLPEQREAFELTQLVGLSYEEAAAVIGCPVGTVRSRVARARAHLLEAVRRTDAV